MKNHSQFYFTAFSSFRVVYILSATIKGALIRFEKKYGYKPDGILPGKLIN